MDFNKIMKPAIKHITPNRYSIALENIKGTLEFLWALGPKKARTAVIAIRLLNAKDIKPTNKNKTPITNPTNLTAIINKMVI